MANSLMTIDEASRRIKEIINEEAKGLSEDQKQQYFDDLSAWFFADPFSSKKNDQ